MPWFQGFFLLVSPQSEKRGARRREKQQKQQQQQQQQQTVDRCHFQGKELALGLCLVDILRNMQFNLIHWLSLTI